MSEHCHHKGCSEVVDIRFDRMWINTKLLAAAVALFGLASAASAEQQDYHPVLELQRVASGKTLEVSLEEFLKRFNNAMEQRKRDFRLDTSDLKAGKQVDYFKVATDKGTLLQVWVTKDTKEIAGVLVQFLGDGTESTTLTSMSTARIALGAAARVMPEKAPLEVLVTGPQKVRKANISAFHIQDAALWYIATPL